MANFRHIVIAIIPGIEGSRQSYHSCYHSMVAENLDVLGGLVIILAMSGIRTICTV